MGEATLDRSDLDRAVAGDDGAFARLVAPLRAELHAHCYRMLGSVHDADDALQETLLRAWRGLDRFEGRSSVRTWMYAVATHSCLDAARGRQRRALPTDLGPSSEHAVLDAAPRTDVAWLGPYPDERYEQREAVELAFVAALQHLPGNQRAALLMADVLGYSAVETAALLGTTAAAVTSAVQRARATLDAGVTGRTRAPDRGHRAVVAAFARAMERGDADALVALLARDVTWSMPPLAQWYRGRAPVAEFARAVPLGSCGSWRWRATTANNRPAVAFYRDAGEGAFRAWSITACAVRDGRITELTSFLGAGHFAVFGLPAAL
ncbi:RNA polymerase subunit sigma-70 [Pseudonocardia humida]|uniref:RNA polymerase subunit sigma-70 n=1 Tax=Pseudonocardia humida TaxID=2800819 RepID=A0ABT0ZX65_9PSEU|nr:RNA polymerase subunit sigma-70 [Pseudonocardia humida]MCO1655311.1 RNA polymerase subunit sigma-70 [Pseudonocardia humida]